MGINSYAFITLLIVWRWTNTRNLIFANKLEYTITLKAMMIQCRLSLSNYTSKVN